ncbi:oxysterol-binding protein related protein OSH3 [Sporobolomyces salmoneus]|uniref:oxysterol-binding protein related protein OSH3 n=1 Tax=Sporobolomyces salmoneus TaxID=183962 RepID=UPI0031778884
MIESPSHSSFSSKSSPLPPLPNQSSSNDHDRRYSQFKINTHSGVVMEGYLLKKKRKKMQGMARRFFRLDYNGALSYSFSPDSPIRDSLSVPISYITARRKQRTLDIDGGNTVYHCKALSVEDFEKWAAALQKFTRKSTDGPGTPIAGTGNMSLPPVSEDAVSVELNDAITKAESMNQPIHELELILQELRTTTASPHFSPKLFSSPTSTSYLSPESRANNRPTEAGSGSSNSSSGGGTLLRFLGKRSNSQSGGSTPSGSTLSVNPPSSSGGGGPPSVSPRSTSFSSPRKASFSSNAPTSPSYVVEQPTNPNTPTGTGNDDFFDAVSTPNALLLQRFSTVLESLRTTHTSLLDTLNSLPPFPSSYHSQITSPSVGFNPSFSFGASGGGNNSGASTPLSPNIPPPTQYASRSAHGFYPTHRGTPSRTSSRASFSSFFSADEGEGWDDASSSIMEGEFVLNDEDGEEDEDEEEQEQTKERSSEETQRGRVAEDRDDSRARGRGTIAEEPEDDEEGSDGGEETDEEVLAEEEKKKTAGEGGRKRSQTASSNYDQKVDRRTNLPSQSGPEEGLLGLAKQVIGKDLSNISLPVTTNEPISALQRIAEELEYTELLDRAVAASDPIERLTLVAVFSISTYGGNKYRVTRKPFNPLLGETFEWIRPDKGFKFIAEKVSHQPLLLAFHADTQLDESGKDRGWEVDGDLATSTTIWGRSMEILVKGHHSIKLTTHGEEYTIQRPSSFVRNLLIGTPYLEIAGDLIISCRSTGSKAIISFKEGSSWGGASSRNKIQGKVLDENGKTVHELVGKWDESVDRKIGKDNFERLWEIKDFPSNPRRFYGFSYFALGLNETTPLDSLHAPTDSRLRPDQLALERGDIDEAEKLKKQVEEKQREKRKTGDSAEPKWFKEQGDTWVYEGKYFETREKEAFEDPDIFL